MSTMCQAGIVLVACVIYIPHCIVQVRKAGLTEANSPTYSPWMGRSGYYPRFHSSKSKVLSIRPQTPFQVQPQATSSSILLEYYRAHQSLSSLNTMCPFHLRSCPGSGVLSYSFHLLIECRVGRKATVYGGHLIVSKLLIWTAPIALWDGIDKLYLL